MRKRVKLTISGIVQGVGFRPFVYQLALQYDLAGYVLNNAQGVIIDIEGREKSIDDFELNLISSLPVLAKIDTLVKDTLPLRNIDGFEILKSEENSSKQAMIPSDIAYCNECKDDMDNPNSRYHNYCFTTCTNCGPRYSIIETVPYDRKYTSMKYFKMCDQCEREYTNPLDRRYHAQPISCHSCGPILSLYAKNGKLLETGQNAIALTAKLIQRNHIIAIKGMGGFHLVCCSTNANIIKKLRMQKNRPTKPFAVMCKDMKQVQMVAKVSMDEEKMIDSMYKPIVLVKKIKYNRLEKTKFKVAECVAPHTNKIGIFLPYTALQYQLFKHLKYPIVATSANLGSEPVIKDHRQLIDKLDHVVEYYLDYNRDIVNACDDSVLQMIDNRPIMMRLARGFAPFSFKSPYVVEKPILAVGANQKNCIALAINDQLILSPHIGDLNSLIAFEYFTRTIETFKMFYDFKPELIVCDKHPNYETTKWAMGQECEVIQVQHHYAHVLACMLEHNIEEKVLAFSWDGTGYGDDKTIWGGEVFIANEEQYERCFSLNSFKLLGGDMAVKEPKRVALSLLFECYDLETILALNIPSTNAFTEKEIKSLYIMWEKSLNAPQTTSMGRLFDAVASIGGFLQTVSYDGESGLLIESNYDERETGYFNYEIVENEINLLPMIEQLVEITKMRILKQKKYKLIATMFINTLVEIIVEIAEQNRSLPVVLTGGIFQNKTLLTQLFKCFEEMGIEYYFQQKTPINDGGIAFGQLLAGIKHLQK